MNSFGRNFRITLFGESHGEVVGVVVDGARPGIKLKAGDFDADMERRRGGTGKGTTMRREDDRPHIITGIYNGHTTGAPVTILFYNKDISPEEYISLCSHPRPSHADHTAKIKYGGLNDPGGGGMFSGRMTVGLVAAGVIAKKILCSVGFDTKIVEVGGSTDNTEFEAVINKAVEKGDSAGGVVEVVAKGIPAGIGEPFFDSVESVISHMLFSIPGVKGVEFGAGFDAARKKGSENNDLIINSDGGTSTNNDGGINGGITNGNLLVVRVAIKPTPSIAAPQETFNFRTERIEKLQIKGRHDACIALRAAVVAEASVAIALADLMF